MNFWYLLGIIAVVGSAFHLVPQVWKSLKTKRTADLSSGMLLVHLFSSVAWLSYGMHIKDVPLVAVSVVNIGADVTLLIIKRKYSSAFDHA